MITKHLLQEASKIQQQISELEKFLYVVVEFDENSRDLPSTSVIMVKTVETKISLVGFRKFGIGKHTQEIFIPDQIRNDLLESCRIRMAQLQEQLDNLFKNNN